jgi:hypothetical protein
MQQEFQGFCNQPDKAGHGEVAPGRQKSRDLSLAL